MAAVHIISRSGEAFADRIEAGTLLAEHFGHYKDKHAVVLGIPRGGILVARQIAHLIGGDLDIMLSRKLGAPYNPELAIGAIGETGQVFLNEDIVASLGVEKDYIQQEKERQWTELKRRAKLYRQFLPKVPLKKRIVILTDDGVATGATMQVCLRVARQEGPKKLIAALPVAPPQTVEKLSQDADSLVCLRAPDFFSAVGQFYARFAQVEDQELLDILKEESLK